MRINEHFNKIRHISNENVTIMIDYDMIFTPTNQSALENLPSQLTLPPQVTNMLLEENRRKNINKQNSTYEQRQNISPIHSVDNKIKIKMKQRKKRKPQVPAML